MKKIINIIVFGLLCIAVIASIIPGNNKNKTIFSKSVIVPLPSEMDFLYYSSDKLADKSSKDK